MRALEDRTPPGPDGPPVEFWENQLELPATRLLEEAISPEFMDDWLQRRRPQQVAVLRHLLGLPVDAPQRERKTQLRDRPDELIRFVPAASFAVRKSMHATLDVALGCVDEPTVALAQGSDDSYDTTALMFGILDQSWRDLEKVFHLDKLHKVGFARMRLRAHVFLCLLAYHLEWHLRQALAPLLFDDHERAAAAAERPSRVAKAKPSPAARRKAQTQRTDDGLPVHSFRSLMADLATLTRNTVRFGRDHTTTLLATPTEIQRRALQLLDVPLAL